MAEKNRDQSAGFGLSFLDIMFCGFGAAVLLVMILNGKTMEQREEVQTNLRAELSELVNDLQAAQKKLADNQAKALEAEEREANLKLKAEQLADQLAQNIVTQAEADTQREELEAELEKRRQELYQAQNEAELVQISENRDGRPVGFDGEGRRQYLTGLKLGGERTLILLDSSASMTHAELVNVVRKKLMSAGVRKQAPKWRRAVRITHWLIANLQPDKLFQIYAFNEDAMPLVPGSAGQWLATNKVSLQSALSRVHEIAPLNGTNLHAALEVAVAFNPPPDSVIIVTDGLPTIGPGVGLADQITPELRRQIFIDSVKAVPGRVPVNVFLLPLEGDPEAASLYWSLAVATRGSFMTPAAGWP